MRSTLRTLRPIYGPNNRPSRSTSLVEKFESTGTEQNVSVPMRQINARSIENISAAEATVEECDSHSSFSNVGHLCDVVVANFAKLS